MTLGKPPHLIFKKKRTELSNCKGILHDDEDDGSNDGDHSSLLSAYSEPGMF